MRLRWLIERLSSRLGGNKGENERDRSTLEIDLKRDEKHQRVPSTKIHVRRIFNVSTVSQDKFKSSPLVDRAMDSEWIRTVMPELARWRCRDTFKVVLGCVSPATRRSLALLPLLLIPREVIFKRPKTTPGTIGVHVSSRHERNRERVWTVVASTAVRVDKKGEARFSPPVTGKRFSPRNRKSGYHASSVTGFRNRILGALSRSNGDEIAYLA